MDFAEIGLFGCARALSVIGADLFASGALRVGEGVGLGFGILTAFCMLSPDSVSIYNMCRTVRN